MRFVPLLQRDVVLPAGHSKGLGCRRWTLGPAEAEERRATPLVKCQSWLRQYQRLESQLGSQFVSPSGSLVDRTSIAAIGASTGSAITSVAICTILPLLALGHHQKLHTEAPARHVVICSQKRAEKTPVAPPNAIPHPNDIPVVAVEPPVAVEGQKAGNVELT